MPLIPSKLPLWAYGAAGAAAFLAARAASRGAGAAPAPAATTAPADTTAGSGGTSLWDVYGGGGAYGTQLPPGSGGVLPGVSQPIPVTITDPWGNPVNGGTTTPPPPTFHSDPLPVTGTNPQPIQTTQPTTTAPAVVFRSATAKAGATIYRGSGSGGTLGTGSPVAVYHPAIGTKVTVNLVSAWGTSWWHIQGGAYAGYGFVNRDPGWTVV